jgi:arylsulfatase B
MVKQYGDYDGKNLLPQLRGQSEPQARRLFWRLQGQTAILDGSDKLITLSHRPAQMFRPAEDPAESTDRFDTHRSRAEELYRILGQWESTIATVPLWGSSPYWQGQSADLYDKWIVRPEPK